MEELNLRQRLLKIFPGCWRKVFKKVLWLKDYEEVEDTKQDMILLLLAVSEEERWQNKFQVSSEKELESWCCTVMVNQIKDKVRKRKEQGVEIFENSDVVVSEYSKKVASGKLNFGVALRELKLGEEQAMLLGELLKGERPKDVIESGRLTYSKCYDVVLPQVRRSLREAV